MDGVVYYGLYSSIFNPDKTIMASSDEKLCYELVDKKWLDEDDETPQSDPVELIPYQKLDYEFFQEKIPLSFLAVDSVERGMEWYAENTKMPDCMIPYLARYHWGDLKPEPSNITKKQKKKLKKQKEKFAKHHGTYHISFD